jgi:hypothetical protein
LTGIADCVVGHDLNYVEIGFLVAKAKAPSSYLLISGLRIDSRLRLPSDLPIGPRQVMGSSTSFCLQPQWLALHGLAGLPLSPGRTTASRCSLATGAGGAGAGAGAGAGRLSRLAG